MIHSIISSGKKEIIYITDCFLKNFSCSLVAAERAVYESKLSKTNRNENDPSYIFHFYLHSCKTSNVNKDGVNSLKGASQPEYNLCLFKSEIIINDVICIMAAKFN